ncbi:MAG: cell division protein FtsL [Gammaproteobacteria bacterium]|nr:cell division protein FtsL [Gammaproteobacteria bacterium]
MRIFVFWILVAAVFISAVEVVVARHQARKLFVEIQTLEKVRDELDEEWGRLQLEQSTWATDIRIESLTHGEMDMKTPDMNSIVLLAK